MPTLHFTPALQRFFPQLAPMQIPAATVRELLTQLDARCPGLVEYLTDETGAIRAHVNIFVNNQLIADRVHLSDTLSATDEVFVMQAISGG